MRAKSGIVCRASTAPGFSELDSTLGVVIYYLGPSENAPRLGWMRRMRRLGLIGLPLPHGHPDNSKPRMLVSMHATRWLFHGSKGATSRTRTSGSSPGELPRAEFEESGPHSDERRPRSAIGVRLSPGFEGAHFVSYVDADADTRGATGGPALGPVPARRCLRRRRGVQTQAREGRPSLYDVASPEMSSPSVHAACSTVTGYKL